MTTAAPTLAPDLQAAEQPLLPTSPYVSPRVNLLPPEVAERKALRKLQAALAAGVIACAGVVGGLYVMANSGRADAQASLDRAVTQGAVLQGGKNRLASVEVARTKVQSTRTALVSAMSAEVLWSHYLDDIRLRLPDGVRLSSLTVTPAAAGATGGTATGSGGATGTGGATSHPATTSSGSAGASLATLPTTGVIATVNVSGKAIDHDHVADWLDAMAKIRGWSNVYLTNTTADQGGSLLTFAATADIGSAALSHRFTNGS